jgi:hypothetical protein
VTPSPESTPTDLQVTADSLKTAVREAQRTASELRTELEEQRKEMADAQVARAQLQGMLRETERRLADARQVIELQREELASARTERERVAQTMAPLHSRAQHPPVGVRLQRKRVSSGQDEVVPAPAETQEQSAVKPLEDGGEAVPQSTPADGEAAPVSDVPQASPIVMPTPVRRGAGQDDCRAGGGYVVATGAPAQSQPGSAEITQWFCRRISLLLDGRSVCRSPGCSRRLCNRSR